MFLLLPTFPIFSDHPSPKLGPPWEKLSLILKSLLKGLKGLLTMSVSFSYEELKPISWREGEGLRGPGDHINSCHSKTSYGTTFKLGDFYNRVN